MQIERDALSRIKQFISPFYTSYFDKDAFDKTGNLIHYSFNDTLGSETLNYAYDDLDQLIAESDRLYSYDSIGNRLEKNGLRHQINDLSQLLNDGVTPFDYDKNGNLIFDGAHSYTYDTLDRLTAIQQGSMRILFTYDAFNRRLSKAVYDKGVLTKKQLFLWDGDNEIGSSTPIGDITELRILGEGLGAEIGAAVFIELNHKSYIPIHDHRGCLVSLISKDQATKESYRYTAFGEELILSTLSPWRFASKRVDEETGFVYFGRRYYQPSQGRWITPDPQGFIDGPNLYAYLHNSPLDDFDLYGLFAWKQKGEYAFDKGFEYTMPFTHAFHHLPSNAPIWQKALYGAGVFADVGMWALPATKLVAPAFKLGMESKLLNNAFKTVTPTIEKKIVAQTVLKIEEISAKTFQKNALKNSTESILNNISKQIKLKPDFIADIKGVIIPTSRAVLEEGFIKAGFPVSPTRSPGMQYIINDNLIVRIMESSGPAPLRASFTNKTGGYINPFTNKPPQPPRPAPNNWKEIFRRETHLELFE